MTETMDVRIGGQIVRRPVDRIGFIEFADGRRAPMEIQPVTHDGELAIFTIGDPIPTIIKTLPL